MKHQIVSLGSAALAGLGFWFPCNCATTYVATQQYVQNVVAAESNRTDKAISDLREEIDEEKYLKPSSIVAGANVTVSTNTDGIVTISATGGGAGPNIEAGTNIVFGTGAGGAIVINADVPNPDNYEAVSNAAMSAAQPTGITMRAGATIYLKEDESGGGIVLGPRSVRLLDTSLEIKGDGNSLDITGLNVSIPGWSELIANNSGNTQTLVDYVESITNGLVTTSSVTNIAEAVAASATNSLDTSLSSRISNESQNSTNYTDQIISDFAGDLQKGNLVPAFAAGAEESNLSKGLIDYDAPIEPRTMSSADIFAHLDAATVTNAQQSAAIDAVAQSATNYTDSATNTLISALTSGEISPMRAVVADSANEATTAYGLGADGDLRTPQEIFAQIDAATETNALQTAALEGMPQVITNIVNDLSSPPGNYLAVSNAAMNALSRTEAEKGFTEWDFTSLGHLVSGYKAEFYADDELWLVMYNDAFLTEVAAPENAVRLEFTNFEGASIVATRTRLPTMADIAAATNGIPRITESASAPGWAANADHAVSANSATDAQNANFANNAGSAYALGGISAPSILEQLDAAIATNAQQSIEITNRATKADATLAPALYSKTPTFSGWTCNPSIFNSGLVKIVESPAGTFTPDVGESPVGQPKTVQGVVTSIVWIGPTEWGGGDSPDLVATRTRTDVLSYTLGSQTNKVLQAAGDYVKKSEVVNLTVSVTGTMLLFSTNSIPATH